MSPTSAPAAIRRSRVRSSVVERVDGEREVVDRAAMALLALLADDLPGRHLEHVQRRAATEVEDEHSGVVVLRFHPEADLRAPKALA